MPQSKYARVLSVSAALGIIVLGVWFSHIESVAISPLQSEIPVPTQPPNPKFIFSSSGGRRYCGLEQGPVWLDLPRDFTPEGGAEVHCDLTPIGEAVESLNKQLLRGTWTDRGYLIGIYPQVPLAKPLDLVIEIDPARAKNVCRTCFSGRYYDQRSRRWQNLPTTYDLKTSRVSVRIDKYLPRSEYPAYPDRILIALFRLR